MKLVDLSIKEYFNVSKSGSSTMSRPGGGSVSAFAGAQGIGMLMLVCDLTTKREKFAEFKDICEIAKIKSNDLYSELIAGIDRDIEAYHLISAAYKLPKNTEEEEKRRSRAIQDATVEATQVPFKTMEHAYEGLLIAESIMGKSNPNAVSDIGVAILNLESSIKGAWLNIKINLTSLKSRDKVNFFNEEGSKIYSESVNLAKKLYNEILKSFN